MNNSLRFGWEIDLVVMDYFFRFQYIVEIFVLTFLHSTIVIILKSKKTLMASDIKHGYLVDQVGMIFYGWMLSFIVKPYPTYPWPGIYCDGLICTLTPDIERRFVMLISAIAIISVVPFFQYLTFRMYSRVISGTGTQFHFGESQQRITLVLSTALLTINVISFLALGEESEFANDIYNSPEIKAIVQSRGGRLIIFGYPGAPGIFAYHVYLLFGSTLLIVPSLLVPMAHARRIIKQREHRVSMQTQKAGDRLVQVFVLQIYSTVVYYVFPLSVMLGMMLIDSSNWPGWLLSIIRPTIMVLLSLKSSIQSLIYLYKNPVYTKRVFLMVISAVSCAKSKPRVASTFTQSMSKSRSN